MNSGSRAKMALAILAEHYPYRVRARHVRRLCELLPKARKAKHRIEAAWFIAAVAALPYRLDRPR